MTEESDQEALFEIEGPDEDECVWVTFTDGEVRNLGPRAAVAERMCAWLAMIEYEGSSESQ